MQELASGVAVAITVFGTVPYAIGMLRGQIRPHAFTWLVWTVTTLIAFVGQLVTPRPSITGLSLGIVVAPLPR